MAKVLVMYYTRTGNTQVMAQEISESMKQVAGIEVDLKPVGDVDPSELKNYDVLIMGSPTYYGSMPWECKKLIDDSVKYHGELAGKLGGAFTSSANIGGGNETTLLNIHHAWLIHGMVVLGMHQGDHYGPVGIKNPDERSLNCCRDYARRMAELACRLYPSH